MARIDQTVACRAVLIEVANVLGAFRDEIVVVGGWVPELRFPDKGHVGSLDVDLAVSRRALSDNVYTTILQRLKAAGYHHQSNPSRFLRPIPGADPVKVDLISGQYLGGPKADAIPLNELHVNTLRGLDLAFEAWDDLLLRGSMPDGTQNTVRVHVVRPEAYILIKAFALAERMKDKDAYDIAFILRYYQPSLKDLADRVRSLLAGGLAREGYDLLRSKFETLDSPGPVWAARYYLGTITGTAGDEDLWQRAAFENAQELFRNVEGTS